MRPARESPADQPSNSARVQWSSPAANGPFGPAAHSAQSGSQRLSSALVPVRPSSSPSARSSPSAHSPAAQVV
ncbi:hypothetical protein CDL15_Pgr018783 [Punica granatum]|uniref:Uncharacterized protein n=1 Tax=Punica granatum TaxID=22663 RepID=A0A218VWE6_PUNGR|nr:hypothetical protein CDL15_Pgr018783 [Punica granatum]